MTGSEIGKNTIYRNIAGFFGCGMDEISGFHRLSGGLSNTSFVFSVRGAQYVYRHPGDGNGKFVDRAREKKSLEAARNLGLEPSYIGMDAAAGWKISRFIPSFRAPDYNNFKDTKKVITVLQKLHLSGVRVSPGIRPWDDACEMEKTIKERRPESLSEYRPLREKILHLYAKTRDDGVAPCFCHGDSYAPNWMILPGGNVILTDWEYAGLSDPGMDVGYYIADAGYAFAEAEAFIRLYLGDTWSSSRDFHFKAYIAIAAWYWMIWALYRMAKEPADRAEIYPYFQKWKYMAEKYAAAVFG